MTRKILSAKIVTPQEVLKDCVVDGDAKQYKDWQETIKQVEQLSKTICNGNLNYDDMDKVRDFIASLSK